MKKVAVAALLAMILLLPSACGPKRTAAPPVSAPASLLAQANEAYLAARYDDAIPLYQSYLQGGETRQRDHARLRLGLLYAWQGDYPNALQQLQNVETDKLTPENKSQVTLLIPLLKRASQDATEKQNLKQTLNDIMKKLDS